MSDIPLPEPFDYCYEWDGPYGTRKFSPNQYNGRKCDRSVPIFTADQMREYADARVAAAVAAERERCARVCDGKAKEWWSIHCATNRHMDTTRKAHDAFCAAARAIRTGQPAEPQGDARDAARYRWMKKNVARIPPGWNMVGWDAAIDAAIAGGKTCAR